MICHPEQREGSFLGVFYVVSDPFFNRCSAALSMTVLGIDIYFCHGGSETRSDLIKPDCFTEESIDHNSKALYSINLTDSVIPI